MTKLERIEEVLESLRDEDIVEVWNRYCEDCNYYDDRIEYMSELDELVCGMKPMDIINTFCDSAFNVNDDYFWFNGCGNPVSSNDPFDQVSVYDLAVHIEDYEEDYGIPEIAEILEEPEESEESEEIA
jgi:hypothetical protein